MFLKQTMKHLGTGRSGLHNKKLIYVHGLLYTTEAHPAGREVSDFRAEAVAMNMGLAAIHTIHNLHPVSYTHLTLPTILRV